MTSGIDMRCSANGLFGLSAPVTEGLNMCSGSQTLVNLVACPIPNSNPFHEFYHRFPPPVIRNFNPFKPYRLNVRWNYDRHEFFFFFTNFTILKPKLLCSGEEKRYRTTSHPLRIGSRASFLSALISTAFFGDWQLCIWYDKHLPV